jgi:hypothetical protein
VTAEALDISLLNETQRRHLLWKAGNLSYMVLPYQRDVYDSLWAWQASKHKIELRRAWKAKGAKYHSLWLFEIGRRWGKTVLVILFLIEFCIRRPGSVGLLCTAYQNSIGSIILKIIRTVFEPEAPPGYCPEYRTSMDGESQILFIPAVNATIKLVGLDLHSGKTRGNFQDFVAITEAGFVTDLHDTYTSVIQPQMKGRPWAWSLMESSTSDIPDHDFQTVLKEDAQLRDAHTFRTIDDTDLTDEEIELELDSVGGRDSAIAQREYYCRIVVDEQRAVIPEFDEGLHLLEPEQHTRPLYAFGITSLDPGVRDKCGLVFFYLDFLSASLVVQSSWAESNQNTVQIAEVIRETERELWQAQQSPLKPPKPISIQDLLKPTAEVLRLGSGQQHSTEIAGARVLPGNVVWTAPEGSMTWWDDEKRSLRANPARRVSDVATQLQLDLRQLHGLSFDTAFKGPGSRKAHINNLRVLFKQCRIKILKTPENAQLIAQLRSGRWNEKQTDFEPSKTLGHLDALMALAYGVRVVPWEKNPYRPTHVDPNEPDLFVSAIYEKKVMRPQSTRRRHGR